MKIQNSMSAMPSGGNKAGGMNSSQDSQVQALKKQIANVQQQMQKLSTADTMTPEQKMEKRKELQQELQELTKQLSQRELEVQKEKREKAAQAEPKDTAQNTNKSGAKQASSTAAMSGILQADAAMDQVKASQTTKNGMERTAKVLAAEIKTDGARGGASETKKAELSSIEERIEKAAESVGEKIGDVYEKLEEEDKKAEKTDRSEKLENSDTVKEKKDGEQNEQAVTGTKGQNKYGQTEGQYVDIFL